MKIIRTAKGKNKIKLSKREWIEMGKKGGWIKSAFSTVSYPTTVLYTLNFNDQELDLVVDVRVTGVENDGIGPYEYWGSKGYDTGTDSISDFEVEDVKLDENPPKEISPENKSKIISILEDSDRFRDKVQKEIATSDIKSYHEDMAGEKRLEQMQDEGLS